MQINLWWISKQDQASDICGIDSTLELAKSPNWCIYHTTSISSSGHQHNLNFTSTQSGSVEILKTKARIKLSTQSISRGFVKMNTPQLGYICHWISAVEGTSMPGIIPTQCKVRVVRKGECTWKLCAMIQISGGYGENGSSTGEDPLFPL